MAWGLEVWSRLSLTDEEERVAVCDEDESEERIEQIALCLWGKLLIESYFNPRTMKAVLKNIWKPARGKNREASKARLQLKFEDPRSQKWNQRLNDTGREDMLVDELRAVRVGNEVFTRKKHDSVDENEMGGDEGTGNNSSKTVNLANQAEVAR
ncbi:hypothetical protein Cgig2_019711 [Carnegiea gigantea]|uniref:Uncharacterized protein n=1 Tax=Carnegiea gigantea TaxID=171969 RepID=A0A9Q1KND7_9CARY|nr:hypothetical protein Cgig2_019711 [Carnegiea gigantea]